MPEEIEKVEKVEKVEKATAASKKLKSNDEKFKAFQKVIEEVNKQMTPKKADDAADWATLGFLTDMHAEVERFSSGSVVLDSITGGGIPKGRIIEIFGPEASGKTSIALNCIANVQREGGNCVFFDVEQALDPVYAAILGVNLETLGLSQPSIAEDILKMTMALVNSGQVDLIVIDSVASMSTRAEAEADIEKASVASLARLMSKVLRMLVRPCQLNNCTIIFLNQTRDAVGQMFGNPEVTPGGKALKFYASQRIRIRKKGIVSEGDVNIGTTVEMKVLKNKVAAPFGVGETVLSFKKGINRPAEIAVVGEKFGIITKTGRSFFFKSTAPLGNLKPEQGIIKIASCQADAVKTLEENKELFNAIATKIDKVLQGQRSGNLEELDS